MAKSVFHFLSHSQSYLRLIEEVDEAMMIWQKEQKAKRWDVRFNAKRYFANILGYIDENILYKFLDPNNSASVKFGIEDLEKIICEIKDFAPLENYIESLKQEFK